MGWLYSDFLYGFRILSKDKGFSLLTVLVISIGSAIAIFAYSLTSNLMFSPLQFDNQKPLYQVEASKKGEVQSGGKVNYADYVDIKSQVSGVQNLGAYYTRSASVGIGNVSERMDLVAVSREMFDVTGTLPTLGRMFSQEDMQVGGNRVVVVGEQLATQIYQNSQLALGKSLQIDGDQYQVVGVMPQAFRFPVQHQIWVPLREKYQQHNRTQGERVAVFGQLSDGQSAESVAAELEAISQRLAEQYPESNSDISFGIQTYKQVVLGEGAGTIMTMVLIVAAIVLLLACVNVASLLSVKASRRIKETSIQIALGAPRFRIIGQIVIQALIVCTLGTCIGLVLCFWGLKATQEALALLMELPFWWTFSLDSHTVAGAGVVIVLSSILSSIWPALQTSEGSFNQVLTDGTRGALGRRSVRFNYVIVFIELTLSFIILVYSGLNVAKMDFINSTGYGVKTDNILIGSLSFEPRHVNNHSSSVQLAETISARVAALDAVEDVAVTTQFPGTYPRKLHFQPEGLELAELNGYPYVNPIYVSRNYFDTLGIKLHQGRWLDSRDDIEGVNNVLVDVLFVQEVWPDENPVGKRFRVYEGNQAGPWLTVVGVTGHVVYGQVQSNALYRYSAYYPLSKTEATDLGLIMSLQGNSSDVQQAIRQAIYQVDSSLPIYEVNTMQSLIAKNSGGSRFMSSLFFVFAIASLVLSGSCILAIISFLVAQRSQDIAVMQALGATEGHIVRLYLRNSCIQFAVAAAVGLPLAYLASQTIDTVEFASMVPATYLVVVAMLLTLVLVATILPVLRTLKHEPYETLTQI